MLPLANSRTRRRFWSGSGRSSMLLATFVIGCATTIPAERELRDERNWLRMPVTSGGATGAAETKLSVAKMNNSAVELALTGRARTARSAFVALLGNHPPEVTPYLNYAQLETLIAGEGKRAWQLLCQNTQLRAQDLLAGQLRLVRLQRFEQLVGYVRVLRSCRRSTADMHVRLGEQFVLRGQYRPALAELDLALASQPEHGRALYLTGLIYMQAKDWRRAAGFLDLAAQQDQRDPRLDVARAGTYLELRRPRRTLQILANSKSEPTDDALELRIRAQLLLDWRADVRVHFRQMRSRNRRERLSLELFGNRAGRASAASERALRLLY